GGATPDTSIYANAFFPKTLEIGVGDTVTWVFEGFHNVAFLGGGATPPFAVTDSGKMYFNPLVVFPAGDKSYDGTGYHNSGTPGPDGKLSYTLTFTKPGRYSYICAIHSGMRGMVIVKDKATETPAAALKRGRAEQAATLAAGRGAFANLHVAHHGTTFVVPLVGNSQQRYSVLRFTPKPLVVPRGSTVTWTMRDTFEVHTVTFTSGEKPPQFVVPEAQPGGPPKLLLNPRALTPTTTTQYDGTGYVNSGMLFPPGNPAKLPSSYSLTFTTPGRFEYWCLIHADVGQRGTIIVQ
ncbi:MAG TPA: plastocyanin/azurin family copper-binding protein, partial [Gemmatimonadales bacterium]|nr:plastocyanin/azurin family copper-binding protein [Gemmatimonadales bacterium]